MAERLDKNALTRLCKAVMLQCDALCGYLSVHIPVYAEALYLDNFNEVIPLCIDINIFLINYIISVKHN